MPKSKTRNQASGRSATRRVKARSTTENFPKNKSGKSPTKKVKERRTTERVV